MDFSETESDQLIRKSIREITGSYDEDYWCRVRNKNEQPDDFRDDLAANDWYGLMIPEKYGGQGLGLREMTIIVEELGLSGGGRTATNLLLFAAMCGGGLLPRHGSDAQKETWLPKWQPARRTGQSVSQNRMPVLTRPTSRRRLNAMATNSS